MSALAFAEKPELYPELSNAASALGLRRIAVVVGPRKLADETARYFDKVYHLEAQPAQPIDAWLYADVVAPLAKESSAVLVPSSVLGAGVAGILSYKLGMPAITDVRKIERVGDRFVVYRGAYGGLSIARISAVLPLILSIRPGAFEKAPAKEAGEIVELDGAPRRTVEVVEVKRKEAGTRLEDADVVVVAGRGVKKREDLGMLEGLAKALGGVLSCTMPLSSERGWFPSWVGISGVVVKPRLYIGIGVSGQVQHVAGIRDARIIVAVNSDPNAPIFEYVDYGIVGDLYKVVPSLLEKIKEIKF